APLVGNGPGAMALFRIPYLPHSAANDLVKVTTPPLATAEGTTYPEPVNAYVVTIFNTFACCRLAIQFLPKVNVQLTVPLRTMSIIVEKAFAERRSVGDIKFPAALLIKTSTLPKRSSLASKSFSTSSTMRISQATGKTGFPVF